MMNRRSFLDLGARASALAVLPRVGASSSAGSLSAASSASWYLSIHTDPKMWAAIQAHIRPGDMYRSYFPNLNIPWSMRTYSFPDYATLVAAGDQKLARYSTIHLDGEGYSPGQASAEAPKIRAFVDAYNQRHPTLKLTWVAYYINSIILAEHAGILQYPDMVTTGASRWQTSISAMQSDTKPYMDMIRAAGRIPSVRLCDYDSPHNSSRVTLTASQLAAQIQAVVDPPPAGMGITHVEGFYFYTAPSTSWPAAVALLRG